MHFADQCRNNMGTFQIIVVFRAIKIGRHSTDEVSPVLPSVGLTKHNTRDFGGRIPLVGRLERTREQRVFGNRLWSLFRIGARTTKEEEFSGTNIISSANQISLNQQILLEKVDRVDLVRTDAAY